MISFIIKGLFRDKSRSLLAIIIVALGVFLTVAISGYMRGVLGDLVDETARLQTGHVRITTISYAKNEAQMPLDLALLGVDTIIEHLQHKYSNYEWEKRIRFGGLLDVPDINGNSKTQGPALGMAIDMLSPNSAELKRLHLKKSLVSGKLAQKNGEALIGNELSKKLEVKIGDKVSFITTTMNGSLTFQNFTITGTVSYGVKQMDNALFIVDISDAQNMLDMQNGASEILGFSKSGFYDNDECNILKNEFNKQYSNPKDEFSPLMKSMKDDPVFGVYLDYVNSFTQIMVFILIFILSIVLWNAGLLGGLRRYNEFGIRLALGEEKLQIYKTLLYEAVFVGIVGSIIGTAMGISLTLYLQYRGIDVSNITRGGSMMMPNVFRAKYTPDLLYIGFIPGVLAMVIGNMLSGIAIFRRQTANLLKEIEI